MGLPKKQKRLIDERKSWIGGLTEKQKSRIAETLVKVRLVLEHGSGDSVYCAIAGHCYALRQKDCWLTHEYIQELIFPYRNVKYWAIEVHGFTPPQGYTWEDYNLAWIDHMIRELEK